MSGEYVEQRNGGYYVVGTRVSLDSVVHSFRRGNPPQTKRYGPKTQVWPMEHVTSRPRVPILGLRHSAGVIRPSVQENNLGCG
jgi:hypothetical protein